MKMIYRQCQRQLWKLTNFQLHNYNTIKTKLSNSRSHHRLFCTNNSGNSQVTNAGAVGHAPINYSTIYKDRTGITSGLWKLRLNLAGNGRAYDADNPPIRSPLISKASWQSSIVVSYDFVSKPSTLNEYIRFDGGVRFGRILEDMDSLAGNVAETHNYNNDDYPISFVTASVDRIDLKRHFPVNRNLVMQGEAIYVGRSSINIQISISDKESGSTSNSLICTANFIMVAIDGITNKSVDMNPLLLDTEESEINFIRGKFDAQLRKQERLKRLTSMKPSTEESEIIHEFWLDTHVRSNIDMNDKDKYISINKSSLSSVVICQPQHLNRSGKIFGGYLMKIAFELARVTAYQFIGGMQDIYNPNIDLKEIIEHHPQFVSSDEISFEHPVSVGCIIRNESYVSCTDTITVMNSINNQERKAMMILVRTYIQEPGQSDEILSNIFLFCFAVPKPKKLLKRVIPLTYEESMIYLNGKRALDQSTKIAIRDGSTFATYL